MMQPELLSQDPLESVPGINHGRILSRVLKAELVTGEAGLAEVAGVATGHKVFVAVGQGWIRKAGSSLDVIRYSGQDEQGRMSLRVEPAPDRRVSE